MIYIYFSAPCSLTLPLHTLKMSEIIAVDPINDDRNQASTSTSTSRRGYTRDDSRPFTRSLTMGRDHVTEPFDSEKLPVTLVSEIQRFLRVANLIEVDEPRVAYLCELSFRMCSFRRLCHDESFFLCVFYVVFELGINDL